ncbi:MAG: response regulator transcription factor [Gemmatimonadota bacterium]|nr:response regulator transcription factor [Gemmatimonadota bacterium]
MSRVLSSRRSAGSFVIGPEHESMVRVLLVDDHEGVRAGLKALLESTGRVHVVGEASSGEEAVEKARTLEPDVVTMDLAMPGMDGVQATRHITGAGPETKVLVLTVHDADEVLIPALDAGAAGFVDKSVADTDLVGAIETIVRGHTYVPRRAAALLARRKARGASNREPAGGAAVEYIPAGSLSPCVAGPHAFLFLLTLLLLCGAAILVILRGYR